MRKLKRYLSLALIVSLFSTTVLSTTAAAGDPSSGAQDISAGLNYDQYPPLKDVYEDYFRIGTVGPLTGSRSALIAYHFNSYTPENEMKPQYVQSVKDTFNFGNLNNLLNNVTNLSNDINLIGHTLAWHSQSPSWMWDAPNFNRDVALDNLNAHIDRVMSEYGERLHSMDVVNEAIGTANPADWKASLNKGEGWVLALGWEWVELAFVRAAKVVDDNGWDTKLYYNDFGLNGAAKAQTVYEMVKDINERYAGTRPNGKALIEGIGMQGHYNSSTKPEDVETTIKLFATLPGVSVSITELDIEWANPGSLDSARAIAQGQKYAQLFQVFKNYAVGSANTTANPKVVERVTFWGSNDGDSWKRDGLPLLFNAPDGSEITAKEALVAVLDPDTYLEKNPIVIEPDQEEKKNIDGVYVYDTSKGDSWSGANIVLGNDANKWPWSTAGADGKVAFTPEKDATYRVTVNYTSLGTSAIRVRWIKDESGGGYTAQDGQVVSTSPYNTNLAPEDVAVRIPSYFNSGMSAGNSYTLVTEIKLDGSQPADGLIGNIAIRGGAGGNSFSVNSITVDKIGTDDVADKPLVNWPDGLPKAGTEGVHVYATETGDSWSGANIILGNSANKWPWSTAGEDGKVAFTPQKDAKYRISVNYSSLGTSAIRVRWVKDESNGGYTAQDGQVVGSALYNASLTQNDVATQIPAYFNSGMVNAGTYTLKTEITLDGSQPADGLIGNIAIRGGAGGNSFVINWITVEKIGSDGSPDKLLVNWPEGIDELEPEPEEPVVVLPPAGQTYEAYTPLKDVYKDHFTLGIFGSGEINALIHNFAVFSPGNQMKPESTQNVKGTFTYESADALFNTLTDRNPNMRFIGHALAWHSQSPTWMWDAPPARHGQPGTFDKETALANLEDHIENVLGYYGGRLEGMDVVNEAVGTSTPGDWKGSLAKGEGWFMALGWEWVELAFLKAAEVVDDNGWDTKLIYNDFGLDSPNKARVVYEMVKDINERYADVRPNGKPLIEVIGMQAHYNLNTIPANVENSIKLFATLPGVNVNITEMDIGTPAVGVLTPENENNQAMKYAELFQIYKKYATGSANTTDNPKVVNRVSISGVRDAVTGWRAGEFALLFDSEGLAKKALIAVLNPDAFLASHEYIESETEEELPPVDGVYVYDTGKGDSWSGANIILGNNADEWPWSTAGADNKVAFTPQQDETYRLSFNYTAKGTTAIRVRWVKDAENGNYTDADGAVVNDYPYGANEVATHIPAYFNSGMVNMGSYTLTTEIKLNGSEEANGLIGNIAIRGGGGGNAFSINWIKVEKIGANGASDELLVNWPSAATVTKHKITATAGVGGTITPSGEVEVVSGENQSFTITPNSNYSIANVLVDGVSVGAVSTYTFDQVTSDHTISAAFSYNTSPDGNTSPGDNSSSDFTIIVNGEKIKIGEVKVNGDITSVTLDQNVLAKQIEASKDNITVVIPATTRVAEAKLAFKNLVDMAAKDLLLTVEAGQVQYNMPAAAIDTAAILAKLGLTDASNVVLSVVIASEADGAAQTAAEAAAAASGSTLVISPISFEITASYEGKTVVISDFSQYVSRTIEVTAEQAAKVTTALVVEAGGKIRHVPTKVQQKDGKWFVIINSKTNSTYALVSSEKTFTDATGKWYESQVNEAGSRMIMNGVGNDVFEGDRSITRAEFTATIVRALGLPENGNGTVFSDVSDTAWYNGAIGTAYEHGLVSGVGNGKFNPDKSITREETMLIIWKAAQIAGYAGSTGSVDAFSDAEQISNWALDAAQFCVGSQLFVGFNGALNPLDNITRAETAKVVLALLKKAGLL